MNHTSIDKLAAACGYDNASECSNLKFELVDQYIFRIQALESDWVRAGEVTMILSNAVFADTLTQLFSEDGLNYSKATSAHSLMPRIFRSDSSEGYLGWSSPGVKLKKGQVSFLNGGIEYGADELIDFIGAARKNVETIFFELYRGRLGRCLAVPETIWALLFFLFELGKARDEIMDVIEHPGQLDTNGHGGTLDRRIEPSDIEDFERAYRIAKTKFGK